MRGNRRHIALLAAFLWLLGVEVLPSLHLGTHDERHTHASDGTIVTHEGDAELERLHRLAHQQAGTKCLHAQPQRDRLAYHAPISGGHAANGIAHHATALLDPPPPTLASLAVPLAKAWQHRAPIARLVSLHVARPSARGPPVA